MEQRKKALLIAFVLGDGYLRVDKRYPNRKPALKLCHSIKQREYLEHKVRLLHSLLGGKVPVIREYVHTLPNGIGYGQVRCEKAHRYFGVLRRWMYPNKYSVLRYLTAEAIAIWYMDDGSLIVNNRNPDGSCRSARTNIHTGCTKDIADDICKYFKSTWDIKFTPFKEKGTYSVRCFHQEGKKFHNLIHPYIVPSMSYKQRFYFDTSA
jgi:hypothetical protein